MTHAIHISIYIVNCAKHIFSLINLNTHKHTGTFIDNEVQKCSTSYMKYFLSATSLTFRIKEYTWLLYLFPADILSWEFNIFTWSYDVGHIWHTYECYHLVISKSGQRGWKIMIDYVKILLHKEKRNSNWIRN